MSISDVLYSRLEKDGVENNTELFDFAFKNDEQSVLEFCSSTENSKNIEYLSNSKNEEILLALYQNKNASSDIQQSIAERADTAQILLKKFEKSPTQEKLNSFIDDNKESVLRFAAKTKSETVMNMFPRDDDFTLALSKNQNITPKIGEKLLSYKSFNPTKQKEINEALRNNKALPKEQKDLAGNQPSQTEDNVFDKIAKQFDPFSEEILKEFKNSKDNTQKKIESIANIATLLDRFKKKQLSQASKTKSLVQSRTKTK